MNFRDFLSRFGHITRRGYNLEGTDIGEYTAEFRRPLCGVRCFRCGLSERRDLLSLQSQHHAIRNLFGAAGDRAGFVDVFDDADELAFDGGVGEEAGVGEFVGEVLGGAAVGDLHEVGVESQAGVAFDLDAGMPLRIGSSPRWFR